MLSRRLFSTTAALRVPFSGPLDIGAITAYSAKLTPSSSTEDVVSALHAANKLEHTYAASGLTTQVHEVRELIDKVLDLPEKPSLDMLQKTVCTSKYYSPWFGTRAMEVWQQKNPDTPIPRTVAMGPLRKALWETDFPAAFKVVDLSAGSPQHIKSIKQKMLKYLGVWGLFGLSISGAGQGLMAADLLFGVAPATFHILWWAYFANVSIFSVISTAGRFCGNGEVVKWMQGTFYSHYFTHADEMKMVSRIVEIDRLMPENQGQVSEEVLDALIDRKMAPVTTHDEKMMQLYWSESGEGFQWVEPEQDPAEILWRRHLREREIQKLK
ncbi:hypothetical protein B0I72DRAFT_141961 [Yarrowia lipolytica]|jgi:hypothetical protein|uniref:Uncharacterized protein n=1 Tax=Yarrowia lipolytica TaxID=4952 RepID=A0A1D8NNA0_YARLL|nr:hypothetical protein YALI1_F16702g [Yarrowia lipolytica]KAB8280387.1 hypothetical protein BKA91DRAFT_142009 [Yarrowia lipolytica]KAE8172803.1 hypothetical protein BKA90DRAFT_136601 [Yarrowia lipolytica]KAJ8055794.1 hypothetical protein LXG23DRAFT_47773 [Yarrowia lipolytica]RDW26441.1 hypothetical protein B0I71DRAFT_130816 [Yarrowia lipolytica]